MRHLPGLALALAVLVVTLFPGTSQAATRTINFDDFTAPMLFFSSGPVTDRYASLGVRFSGPAPADGGAVLDVASFPITGESVPNALAFNTTASYPGGGVARGPEVITFATPIHSATIRAGQSGGGTLTMTAFDGTTAVSTNSQTSQPELQELSVAASRITSLRLEFSGTASIWDDLTWGTAPVSPNDSYSTGYNTRLNVPGPGVLGNDTDADGDALTATETRSTPNGVLSLRSDGSFAYTPNSGFSGIDSFDYRANDGTGTGNVATVTISVSAAPPPPAAFGAATRVGLSLSAGRIPARGPIAVRVANSNGFAITGRLSGRTTGAVAASVVKAVRVKLRVKRFSVGQRSKKTVKLALPKRLRRVLRREGRLSLRLTATVKDPAGNSRAVRRTVRPKLRKSRRG
jgi:hypothetical protein